VEGMARHNLSVPVISRCASVGGHRYISPWGGDIKYPLKNIKSDLSFIRDAGLVGYASAGSDMGGFSNNRSDKIIFRRVIQQFLVFPVIRPHGKEGSKPPWTVSKRSQEMWRFYCKLRYRLHPYIYSAAIESHQTGRPILAPLVFDYQNDPRTYNADFDFLFGRQILVAPVVKNASRRRLYLPEGNWIHYWTGNTYKGKKKITVRASLTNKNGLPMFIKEGSIIPMIPEMNRIYETSPNPLTLDIYPLQSGTSSYRLLDSQTPFSPVTETRYFCTAEPDRILIQIENSSNGHIMLIHSPRKAVVVSAGGKELPSLSNLEAFSKASEGWFSGKGLFPGSPEIQTINVKLSGSPSSNQSISIEF